MLGQALENHWKITVVKKQKKINSGYPKSDGVRSEKQWECKDLGFSANFRLIFTSIFVQFYRQLDILCSKNE